jgi:glycosyltransferase involved in cell wall biosynthesis
MSELTVTVVIPTYNRAHLLGRAIQSVLKQIGREDEIVVVDDGSTGETRDVVSAFAEPRIHYVRQPHAGAGAARNRGVREAIGDLIAFLDSDDEWLPGKLAAQRQFMEVRTDVLFCFTKMCREDGARLSGFRSWAQILGSPMPYSWFAGLPAGVTDFPVFMGDLYHGAMYYNCVPAGCLVVRREEAEGTLHFSESLAIHEEWECLGRLAQQGKAAFLDLAGSRRQKHDGPRISDADSVQSAECQLAVLHRVWGSDADFLKKHRAEYQALVHNLHLARIRGLIVLGRQLEARAEIRKLRKVPVAYRSAVFVPSRWMNALLSFRNSVSTVLAAPAQ